MCSGDRYPDLVTAVEDPAQEMMDTTRWEAEQMQVSRHLYLILVMLTDLLVINAHTWTRYATVRAAIEEAGSGDQIILPRDVDAMTRKGKGKDTEKEKGVRFEGCCGHCGKWRHRQEDCWSRRGNPVKLVETDTAEPQDMDPPSEQTLVPAAALTRFSLPDDHWNEGWIKTLSNQSSYQAQQGFDGTEILADSGAVEHVCSEHHFPGAPIRLASRVVLRTAAAVLGHKHGYSQKGSKRLDLTCRGDLCFLRAKMENDHVHDCAPVMRDDEDVPVR